MSDRSSRSDAEVRWRCDVDDSTVLLLLAYVMPGIFGGIAVLAGLFLGWLVLRAALDGDFGRAIVLLVVAVLALLARRWVVLALSTGEAFAPLRGRFSRRGIVVASLGGAVLLAASAAVHPSGPFVAFVASWVPAILVAGFPAEGRANPAERTLVADGTEIPVESASNYRVVPFAGLVLFQVSYSRGVPGAPRTLVVPAGAADAVRASLDGGTARSPREPSSVGRSERLVFLVFGLGLLSVAPVLWVVMPPGDGRVLALLAGGTFGLFGAILLWHARHG